jgi:hypothetical protein
MGSTLIAVATLAFVKLKGRPDNQHPCRFPGGDGATWLDRQLLGGNWRESRNSGSAESLRAEREAGSPLAAAAFLGLQSAILVA